MKFTLSWLKDYLDTSATVDEIAAGLLGIGLEVEEISDKTKALSAFTVAYVQEAGKHPNADKLRLCVVETVDGIKQVVCGAPNARTGIKAIIALPGVTIPVTGQVFAPAVIRGSESQAMMCSERELLLSEEHDGIIEVQGDWPVGTPAATALGLDDPMFYVKVTANRPDALGIYGIARDLAAKGLGTLKPLNAPDSKRHIRFPHFGEARLPRCRCKGLPAVCGALYSWCEEWPFACMVAAAFEVHRSSPDFNIG